LAVPSCSPFTLHRVGPGAGPLYGGLCLPACAFAFGARAGAWSSLSRPRGGRSPTSPRGVGRCSSNVAPSRWSAGGGGAIACSPKPEVSSPPPTTTFRGATLANGGDVPFLVYGFTTAGTDGWGATGDGRPVGRGRGCRLSAFFVNDRASGDEPDPPAASHPRPPACRRVLVVVLRRDRHASGRSCS